jgi:hypothetical protein
MSRFVDTGTGIMMYQTSETENKIANLVRKLEPGDGVEFLVGALASVCSDDQLKAFAMHLEERATR